MGFDIHFKLKGLIRNLETVSLKRYSMKTRIGYIVGIPKNLVIFTFSYYLTKYLHLSLLFLIFPQLSNLRYDPDSIFKYYVTV